MGDIRRLSLSQRPPPVTDLPSRHRTQPCPGRQAVAQVPEGLGRQDEKYRNQRDRQPEPSSGRPGFSEDHLCDLEVSGRQCHSLVAEDDLVGVGRQIGNASLDRCRAVGDFERGAPWLAAYRQTNAVETGDGLAQVEPELDDRPRRA